MICPTVWLLYLFEHEIAHEDIKISSLRIDELDDVAVWWQVTQDVDLIVEDVSKLWFASLHRKVGPS
jgi:hypothetical protein